jgi:hypothetical protein
MAVERKWLAVPAVNFTADGTQFGVVTVTDTAGFKVKGSAYITANTKPVLLVQIQRVLSPTVMIVGPPGTTPSPSNFIDVSTYTVILNAQIAFPEQDKNRIKADDIDQAVYESDPVVAKRVIQVDEYGQFFSKDNPIPVDADVTVNSVALFTLPYDSIQASYPTTTQSVFQSYLGGLSGTLQQTVTVNFTDATQNFISTVLRTPVS